MMEPGIVFSLIVAIAAGAGAVIVRRAARSVEKRRDKRDPEAVLRHFVATAPRKYLPKTEP
jgi:hypothetical protein